jgi:hypothetical protein
MQKRARLPLYFAVCLVALAAIESLCPFVWILTPVYGRVIDRDSGQPVANAAVSASWSLQSWEGSVIGYLYRGKTVTDSDGGFRIEVWGLKFHFSQGRVIRTQPKIQVIAEGYLPEEARSSNDAQSAFFYAGAKNNGQVFRLERAGLE